jgi:hypothetical protein
MKNSFSTEFVFQVFSLIISIIIVHAIYVGVIRPNAAAVIEEQRILIEQDPDYIPERSGFVIVKDFEQEACFILMLWAMSIMGYKTYYANRERSLLELDLVPIADGVRIWMRSSNCCCPVPCSEHCSDSARPATSRMFLRRRTRW